MPVLATPSGEDVYCEPHRLDSSSSLRLLQLMNSLAFVLCLSRTLTYAPTHKHDSQLIRTPKLRTPRAPLHDISWESAWACGQGCQNNKAQEGKIKFIHFLMAWLIFRWSHALPLMFRTILSGQQERNTWVLAGAWEYQHRSDLRLIPGWSLSEEALAHAEDHSSDQNGFKKWSLKPVHLYKLSVRTRLLAKLLKKTQIRRGVSVALWRLGAVIKVNQIKLVFDVFYCWKSFFIPFISQKVETQVSSCLKNRLNLKWSAVMWGVIDDWIQSRHTESVPIITKEKSASSRRVKQLITRSLLTKLAPSKCHRSAVIALSASERINKQSYWTQQL